MICVQVSVMEDSGFQSSELYMALIFHSPEMMTCMSVVSVRRTFSNIAHNDVQLPIL